MKRVTVISPDPILHGTISLPASKSISNRLLIIRALSRRDFRIGNLSGSDDTRLLDRLLEQIKQSGVPEREVVLDTYNAGTVFRFLTATLSMTPGSWNLTGDESMLRRPVGILVEALRKLGAGITYLGTSGYPPLRIQGRKLSSVPLTIDTSVSSQFVSALLLMGPCLPRGLTIRLTGTKVSYPYVEMTLRMMKEYGAKVSCWKDELIVHPGAYMVKDWRVEADWSAAAFWYEAAALADRAGIRLTGLKQNSLQGDAVVAKIYKRMGVETMYEPEGILLKKKKELRTPLPSSLFPILSTLFPLPSSFNLSHYPDLAPALIATCAARGIPVRFTGLHHLEIKESDRLKALLTELNRLGISTGHPESGVIELSSTAPLSRNSFANNPVTIQTYGDHRIAMAFAPLALKKGILCIEDPRVVSKSYPGFWRDMKCAGFIINAQE